MKMHTKIAALLVTFSVSLLLLHFGMEKNAKMSEFMIWKLKHNIKYDTQHEEMYRELIFNDNIAKINAHNSKIDRTYDMGSNQFTALTTQQFIELYLMNSIQVKNVAADDEKQVNGVGADVDWTTKGAVTPVKDQGKCPSPWAFATTGALEGLSKISYGKLQQFSQQQLVDCTAAYGNLGCNGGLADYSFKFVKEKGIATQKQYPYIGQKQSCKQPTGNFKISGYSDLSSCSTLQSSLALRPISVAADASNWLNYKSGVFSDCGTRVNHYSLLVGVNSESWKLKNSWGETWGENGYIRLKKGNTCGVCNVASYPLK